MSDWLSGGVHGSPGVSSAVGSARLFRNVSVCRYEAEQLDAATAAFWWLNDYLGGRTPVAFYQDHVAGSIAARYSPEQLKRYIERHRQNSNLDYGDASIFADFDRAYFYRNFLKCLIAAHHLSVRLGQIADTARIIDVGAGVGTFSLACWSMRLFEGARYVLVDEQKFQVDLARYLAERLGISDFSFVQNDAFKEFNRRGLCISSYWLCCNWERVCLRPEEDLRRIVRDGIVLVDYLSNIEMFAARLAPLGLPLHHIEITGAVPARMRRFVGGPEITVHMLIVSPADATRNTRDR